MKFKTDLQEYLQILSKISPPKSSEGHIAFHCVSGKLELHSYSDISSCVVTIPTKVEGEDATFGISLDALKTAIGSRKGLVFEYSNTMLHLKGPNYKVSLSTSDSLMSSDGDDKDGKADSDIKVKIDGTTAHRLTNLIGTAAIKLNSMFSSFVPVGIYSSSDRLFVTCYDNHRVSYIDSKEGLGIDLQCVVPIDSLLPALSVLSVTGFNMTISDSALVIVNKLVKATIQLPTMEGPNLTDVMNIVDGERTGRRIFHVPREEFSTFLDSSRAVSMKERSELTLELKGPRMRASVSTASGQVEASFDLPKPIKKPLSFKIDYEYIDEVVRKYKSHSAMKISFVGGAFIVCEPSEPKAVKGKVVEVPATIISLNQA